MYRSTENPFFYFRPDCMHYLLRKHISPLHERVYSSSLHSQLINCLLHQRSALAKWHLFWSSCHPNVTWASFFIKLLEAINGLCFGQCHPIHVCFPGTLLPETKNSGGHTEFECSFSTYPNWTANTYVFHNLLLAWHFKKKLVILGAVVAQSR